MGRREEAIFFFNSALVITSNFNWYYELFWIRYSLVWLFFSEGGLNDADARIEQAKVHEVERPYCLGRAMSMQVKVWYQRRWLDEIARSAAALCALKIFEKLGGEKDVEDCRNLPQKIERAMKRSGTESGGEPGSSGERLNFWEQYCALCSFAPLVGGRRRDERFSRLQPRIWVVIRI